MSKGYDLSDYVDVASRIAAFAAKYPEGSLQSELTYVEGGWLCKAYAYRTAADERPGVGHAFEPVPGKTPYTKDSEAMNAETSAWGRAIVALGFETKHVSSANEIKSREQPATKKEAAQEASPFTPPAVVPGGISQKQMGLMGALTTELVREGVMTVEDLRAQMGLMFGKTSRKELTSKEASTIIDWLKEKQAVPVGAGGDEDIPFFPTA